MSETDVSEITDLSSLRLKRGARKRNIGKVKLYLATIEGLPLKQVQENEARRQFDFLEQQIDRYELIQDRIFDLLD